MGAKFEEAWRKILQSARQNWRGFFVKMPLVMLAVPASYGVYEFARLFVPEWVAFVQAAAFETVYIGMAAYDNLTRKDRRNAIGISLLAVATSVIYNSLAGMFHLQEGLLAEWQSSIEGVVALGILHGAPLAVLAFFVSNFTLHRKNSAESDERGGNPNGEALTRFDEKQGQNLTEVVIETPEPAADFVPAGILTAEEIAYYSEAGFDVTKFPPPRNLDPKFAEAVLLYKVHKSFVNAAKYAKVSHETIRTRVKSARHKAPLWTAVVLGNDEGGK